MPALPSPSNHGFTLTASTDVALCLIFDPAAIPNETIELDDVLETIDDFAARGLVIAYNPAADGSYGFHILVDEEPNPEFVARRDLGVDNARLSIPSGRLVVTGAEDLGAFSEGNLNPERFQPKFGAVVCVPPGEYSVTAFEVNWGEEVEQIISENARPGDERFETIIGVSMGFVVVATVLMLCALVGVLAKAGIEQALTVGFWMLVAHAVFWSIVVPVTKYGGAWKRMKTLRRQVESEHPGNVIVLRRLSAEEIAGPFSVAKYGMGHADEAR